jgi:hypothetical protein
MTPQDDTVDMPDELTTLKARADLMGVSYHPSIKLEKLREKVNATMSAPEPEVEKAKTEADMQAFHIAEASKLVRLRITCMNPNKKDWQGEIYTVGNSVVGTFKKYVPFNAEDGWHVPHIIYQHLQSRECQIFVTVTDSRGNKTRKGKLIKEFALEVLPPLTGVELKELAAQQALAHSID